MKLEDIGSVFDDGGRGHEPRNAGNLQKCGKVRKQFAH
jgi:hypothetical protein